MKRSLLLGVSTGVLVAAFVFAMNARSFSDALAVITCATSAPCSEGNNTSTGPGLLGQSASSHGVIGRTLFNSTGPSNGESAIFGQDLSRAGVYDMGVQGVSTRGYGVRGRSSSNSGVRGDSTSGAGVYGTSTSSEGLFGSGPVGVYAQGSSWGSYSLGAYGVVAVGSSIALYASSSTGDAVSAISSGTSHWAINAQSPNGSGMQLSGGSRGSDTTGGSIGVVARSTNFPLLAALPNGTDLFWIDSAGNVNYTGSLIHRAAAGTSTIQTSDTQATTPAIEETGTARLVYGTANVYLSPSIARSIDPRLGYQVFLTPGGDTRGLYVANKYSGGFTVREVQGGRATLNFDYHVYARTAQPANARVQAAPIVPAFSQNIKPAQMPSEPTRP